jgi:signal transduction histidine kinase
MGTISFWLSFVHGWGGVCIDALNVASQATNFGDCLSTGPLLVFITVTVEEKSDLSRLDWLLMATFYAAIFSAFLMNLHKSYESGVFWFAVMLATFFPTVFLPVYESTRLNHLRNSNKTNVARLLAVIVHGLVVKYFIAIFGLIDAAQTIMAHQVLEVLVKGLFAVGCMDIRFEHLVNSERAFRGEKQANANRRAFMKYLFHEVRTPLSSLSLGIGMLQTNGGLNEQTRENLTNINESVNYMRDTLNNVLLIQRIEEGKLILEKVPFSIVSAITAAALATLESASTSKNIVIKTSFSPLLPLNRLIGDKHRIQLVISNLVSNAIKFSPHNGKVSIDLTCGVKPSLDGRIPVTVSVTDEGCGIDKEDIKKMFSKFVQVFIF